MPYIRYLANTDSASLNTLLGFGLLLLLLLVILKQGKPRGGPTVVKSQSPQDWTDDPKFADNRRKAVAAAFAYHAHFTSKKDTP
ncbi:MAG: hypothetical protein ACO3N7_05760 [Kiritimatiellia bacterium]